MSLDASFQVAEARTAYAGGHPRRHFLRCVHARRLFGGCGGGCLLCRALIAVSYSIEPVELESVQKCSVPWLQRETIANWANVLFHWQGSSLRVRCLGVIQPIFRCSSGELRPRGRLALRCLELGRRSWSCPTVLTFLYF